LSKHWREAQEAGREETGTNAVFLPNQEGAIVGHQGYGWLIMTPETAIQVQTTQGVELALEELNLPSLGWR